MKSILKKTLSILLILIIAVSSFPITVFAKNSKVTVELSKTSYVYDGKTKTPVVTVINSNGTKLKKDTSYTLSYSSGRKAVGTYTVTVKLCGKYKGTINKTYKIVPKETTIKKLSANYASVKVAVNPQKTQTTGYQIQYSQNKNFKPNVLKTLGSNKTETLTVKSLKMNSRYYFRVRTYKTVNGTKYYSAWSSSKNTTTVLPVYKGEAYISVNSNNPLFTEKELSLKSFESYSELDSLGRCGVATASVGIDLMPTEERGAIGSVKPTAWHTVKYNCVSGGYLYNRCHLIAYELSGENANKSNLITGTRYLNIEGMLPFENMVHDYVKETGNHVMYRSTPIFEGENLLATGVQIEGYSVEDKGEGICFNVYCFNVQPGIVLDYNNGDSYEEGTVTEPELPEEPVIPTEPETPAETVTVYVLNLSTKKIHVPECRYAVSIKEENREETVLPILTLTEMGYDICKYCIAA